MEYRFLYRDTNLPVEYIQKYKAGTIILENGFTDASKLRGGPSGNIRYLILSGKGKDLSDVDDQARIWGLVLFDHHTRFKVLDVYAKDNVTQVLITDVPNVDEQSVITAARVDFDNLRDKPAVPELVSDSWKERVEPPLGMSDNGDFFSTSQSPLN